MMETNMLLPFGTSATTFLLLVLWTLPWKGVALWKAARRNDVWWFVALLVVNTAAILEILYIYIWSNRPHTAR